MGAFATAMGLCRGSRVAAFSRDLQSRRGVQLASRVRVGEKSDKVPEIVSSRRVIERCKLQADAKASNSTLLLILKNNWSV